jgi:ribosomal protein S18 acetylase RimI-like enzyme
MSASSENRVFRISPAEEDDWSWIIQGQVEIAWVRLGPEGQRGVRRATIERSVAQRVAQVRHDSGFPSQAFVAKTGDGTPAGYVWIARTHNDATGQLEASLLSQYVAVDYRSQGLGQRLMETAEEWAGQQGLPRISLSVGVRNTLAQRLYESLGYEVEIVRMSKKLAEREDEDLRLSVD